MILLHMMSRVDAVIISHNHYDHLDYNSVIKLNEKFGNKDLNWFVGAGVGEFLKSCGIKKMYTSLNGGI